MKTYRERAPEERSRKRCSLDRLVILCAVCALMPLEVSGEEKPTEPAQPREVFREQTFYVPYDKLQSIFEKEGRGIFLPYEEFLRLWTAAQQRPPEPPPVEPPAAAVIRGGMYAGTVSGDIARFHVTFDLEALKKGYSELPLPFKGVAMESVELSSPNVLFTAKGAEYAVIFPAPGKYQAKIQFSVRIAQEPGKKTISFGVPPAGVSRLDLTIPEEAVRVDVRPTLAVTQTTTAEKATKVLAFLGNSSDLAVSWMPPVGKLAEGVILLAEQSIRTYLGERILKVSTDIAYQVIRGEVDSLKVQVPEGTRLLSVKGDNIREWVQEGEFLLVKLHSAIKDIASRPGGQEAGVSYRLSLSFERILPETPPSLSVPFPRVDGVIRESGWVVFSHEAGLNVRVQSTAGLSQLDRDEIPEPLRANLVVGFRYLAQPLSLGLQVEKIIPVIRSFTTSVATLGREEDVWVGWIDYEIQKAGVFRLEFRIPSRWNVATMGDPAAVEDYQTTDAPDGTRTIAVLLKTKALGNFRLPWKLTAAGSSGSKEATLSPPVVVGSERDRGIFGVSAPKATNLSTIQMEKMTSADVDQLFRSGIMNQVGADTGIPLTYAYREQPATVKVRLEPKETEINVLAQHLVEVSDSGIKLTHLLDYEILYAAVETIRFSAPSALDAELKIEAKEKKEVRKVPDTKDPTVWEIVLQAPAIGGVAVTVTHEPKLKALEPEKPFVFSVPILHASGVREKTGFIAVRKEGTLGIEPQADKMESIDASDLPDKLRRGQIYSAFRYFTPDPSLNLTLTRYDYQPLATTIVNLVHMKSVLSEDRRLKTRATLTVQNTAERQYLELPLDSTRILSIKVAGKDQQPRKRKEGIGTLIQIPLSAGPGNSFPVEITYLEPVADSPMGTFGSVSFATFEILDKVPVTKVELELYLAPEYKYLAWGGNLKPSRFSESHGLWSRFKVLIDRTFQTGQPAPARQARPESPPQAVDVDIRTEGLDRYDFETLAPVGKLSFLYIGGTLYSFIDFLAFLASLVGGYVLMTKARWAKSTLAVLFIFIPLVCLWFSEGAISELFTSILAGGILLFLGAFVVCLLRRFTEWRASRLKLAPDPYLEEAAKPETKTEPEPPPADASRGSAEGK